MRRGCERLFTAMSEDCYIVPGDICMIGGGMHLKFYICNMKCYVYIYIHIYRYINIIL